MITEYNKDSMQWILRISDAEIANVKKGTAMHLFFELAKAIHEHGNLPVKDGYRSTIEGVCLWNDVEGEGRWLCVY